MKENNTKNKKYVFSAYEKDGLTFALVLYNGFIIRSFLPSNKNEILNLVYEIYPDIEYSKKYENLAELLYDLYEGKTISSDFPYDLNLLNLTSFQKEVLKKTNEIKKGEVKSYSDIAQTIKNNSSRAVGNALAKNPLPLIIPCHRVVKKNKEVGGFGGGSPMKVILLKNEGIEIDKGKVKK